MCASLDGKLFRVSEQQPGKNCPPMHPWCRSTTIAHISDEAFREMQRRAHNPETGRTELVPATMTYRQWYGKYAKGNPETQTEQKKMKNYAADQKQHKRYRELLGERIPESFAKFQEMKYNEPEKWNAIKLSFRKQSNSNSAFEDLQEPLQLKHVRKVLSDMGIEYGDTKIKIVRDPELIGKEYFGWTNPNMKEVQLYPSAFVSREELVKTLGHERIHVEQLKMWGSAKTNEEAAYYEKGPRFSEEYWWTEYVRRTGYDGK